MKAVLAEKSFSSAKTAFFYAGLSVFLYVDCMACLVIAVSSDL